MSAQTDEWYQSLLVTFWLCFEFVCLWRLLFSILSGSIWTASTDVGLGPDLGVRCFSLFLSYYIFFFCFLVTRARLSWPHSDFHSTLSRWQQLLPHGYSYNKASCVWAQNWASECPNVKDYKWRLNLVWQRMLYSCTHMATVSVKGLTNSHIVSYRMTLLYCRLRYMAFRPTTRSCGPKRFGTTGSTRSGTRRNYLRSRVPNWHWFSSE